MTSRRADRSGESPGSRRLDPAHPYRRGRRHGHRRGAGPGHGGRRPGRLRRAGSPRRAAHRAAGLGDRGHRRLRRRLLRNGRSAPRGVTGAAWTQAAVGSEPNCSVVAALVCSDAQPRRCHDRRSAVVTERSDGTLDVVGLSAREIGTRAAAASLTLCELRGGVHRHPHRYARGSLMTTTLTPATTEDLSRSAGAAACPLAKFESVKAETVGQRDRTATITSARYGQGACLVGDRLPRGGLDGGDDVIDDLIIVIEARVGQATPSDGGAGLQLQQRG